MVDNQDGEADSTALETPVADRIRARLEAAGQRYFANDNIHKYYQMLCKH